MRVGIVGLLHESNTFIAGPTTIENFERCDLLEGMAIHDAFAGAHHEISGFLDGLSQASIEAVPIFAARALPSGTLSAECWSTLTGRLLEGMDAAPPLDGLLVAPHGATVSETQPDADGHWLSCVREQVGPAVPIIGTIDPHANLSALMVRSCDALIAYRSNPHLDQHARGYEAARLIARTLSGEVRPTMHAEFPPMVINIERQMTEEPHLQPLYALADRQLEHASVLSNSIMLGFPYADVAEMGSSVIVITNRDPELARTRAVELAGQLWRDREVLAGQLTGIDEALDACERLSGPVCLLDMGDNVGGGSAADGTYLAHALRERHLGPAFVCLYDPESARRAREARPGRSLALSVGGKTDDWHGPPIEAVFRVISLHDGRFSEPKPRHGGFTEFDQGPTAVVETPDGLTIMLTSKRVVPFSLQQLTSCAVVPDRFRVLVAKGVNAPIAAYREVCPHHIRVNTPGSTCADLTRFDFHHRRRPMFPFERDTSWSPGEDSSAPHPGHS